MNTLTIQWELLPKELTRKEFTKLVVAQLNKDFGEEAFILGLRPEEDCAQLLFDLIRPVVEVLLEQNVTKLVRWFYRVDINESMVNQIMAQGYGGNAVDELTVIVVKREIQKVFIRLRWNPQDVSTNS
jgi:hypothetical protein